MHRTTLFLILSVLFLPVSCQATGFPKLYVGVTTDKPVYKSGEPIAMGVTVLNQDSKAYHVQFASSKIYDFLLCDGQGQLIWKWSGDKMFAMALVKRTLHPQQPLTYLAIFDQTLPSGKRLGPGKYRLVGEYSLRESPYHSQAAEFEIK